MSKDCDPDTLKRNGFVPSPNNDLSDEALLNAVAGGAAWATEIAAGTQIPLGTVKARMRLGLIRLKRELTQLGLDEP